MAKYKVRKGFICAVTEGKITKTYGEGEIVDFTEQQYQDHAHKLEEAPAKANPVVPKVA